MANIQSSGGPYQARRYPLESLCKQVWRATRVEATFCTGRLAGPRQDLHFSTSTVLAEISLVDVTFWVMPASLLELSSG